MQIKQLVFLGAATAFSEISEIIRDINKSGNQQYKIIAILDDNQLLHGSEIDGVPVCGDLSMVHHYPNAQFIFGIGSYKTRLLRHEIIKRLKISQERFISIIHPSSKIYPKVKIGHGCIIHPGVTICEGAELGAFSIVTFNSVIAPKVILEPYAMITTMSCILTGAVIGHSAFIGVRSVVGENIKIGKGAVVIMGSIVFQKVPEGGTVQGNPAKLLYQTKIPNTLGE